MTNRNKQPDDGQEWTTEQEDPQTYAIIGAAMEVHKVLGNGFLEAVYVEALSAELSLRKIPFKREVEFQVFGAPRLRFDRLVFNL